MSTTKEPFRAYIRVQIKEGEEDNFLQQVAPFVEVTRREPAALQCEAFYEEAMRTVVWLESFEDVDGAAAHFANPEVQALQPLMIPRVDVQVIRFFGAIPTAMQEALHDAGLPVEIADPWPGQGVSGWVGQRLLPAPGRVQPF